jgi:chromosome segregation ATPase
VGFDQAAFDRPVFDMSAFEQELAIRDEQIAELQQAVIELSEQRLVQPDPVPLAEDDGNAHDEAMADLRDAIAAVARRVEALEDRTDEQEKALRHVLAMLIDWIESEGPQRAAA